MKKLLSTVIVLGSLNPLEFDDELVEFLAKSEKFCPHFHMSFLQSACDKTLKSMNRHYSQELSADLLDNLQIKFNNAFIGSDIIVGFRGKLILILKIPLKTFPKCRFLKFMYFRILKELIQEHDMPNQVPSNVKKERVRKIKALSDKKHKDFLKNNINTQREVIIENRLDKISGA